MSHSKMLTTRRRKKKAQKEVDRTAKAAKKLGRDSAAAEGARTEGKAGA